MRRISRPMAGLVTLVLASLSPASAAAAPPEAATEPPPASTTLAPAAEPPVEVTVRGPRNEAARLRRSAEAVDVVETRRAKREAADMGDVVGRARGVSVRRSGGLGSGMRLSLSGLEGDQVRFFLDGVPLDRAGFPFGLANVPVNLIERIEIYRGVVPVRFGADALGGAVNLVSDSRTSTHLAASYEVGSFGTHRASVRGRHRRDDGLFAGASVFVDASRNAYPIDVEVTDARGRTSPATVRRFHDGYRAYGGTLELGVMERPWARRLSLKGFASTYDKELQHNVVMTTPYGEVRYGESVVGATARYEQPLAKDLDLEVLASHAHRVIELVDRSAWVYDWYGRRVRARRVAGEIDASPSDQTIWEEAAFGRALLKYAVVPGHALRLSVSPALTSRIGEERLRSDTTRPDPLATRSTLVTLVSGLDHELTAWGDRLENVLFVKDYLYAGRAAVPEGGAVRERRRDVHALGAGDAVRLRVLPWLSAKASYEYATRLPRPDEVFGNGVLVRPNPELAPETSHNVNVGPRIELRKTAAGDLVVDVDAFVRASEGLIVLLGTDRRLAYQNVYAARAVGVDGAASWTAPKRWLALDGAFTVQDVRNVSSEGTFGAFEGDRIPNRPWLFGSWGARLRIVGLPEKSDAVEPFYRGRWVQSFYRGWESQGLREYKQVVDAQLTHDIGASWSIARDLARLTSTVEVDNVTNAKVYDFFGVQRPGRALFVKVTGEM